MDKDYRLVKIFLLLGIAANLALATFSDSQNVILKDCLTAIALCIAYVGVTIEHYATKHFQKQFELKVQEYADNLKIRVEERLNRDT